MPYAWKLFHGRRAGVFDRALASPPLCCPSRAGFLTGQYPHNHGVLGNVPGYPALSDKQNVLPAWLTRAGYRTAFVGKYLNGYDEVGGASPAPGWASWHGVAGYPHYFDYELNDNGEVTRHQYERADYSTTVFTDRAIEEIETRSRRPLFMWLALNAPHIDASKVPPCRGGLATAPDRETYRRFASEPLPADPSYNESDRSDKPRHVADRSTIGGREEQEITLRWRCALAALHAADRELARLVSALERTGELEDTVLVFVSDNGYFFGEHAIGADKRLPYEAAAHVPLAIRVGERVADAEPLGRIAPVVSTVDLAPTLLDYAGAEPCLAGGDCRAVDGRSLRPLLEGSGGYPADRAILLELNDDAYAYEALRTGRYLYSRIRRDRRGELPGEAVELYDLRADPAELENLARTEPAAARRLVRRLDRRLDRLAECRGSEEERFKPAQGEGDCE
jgi:arylsulfatase A-like enzyme